MQRVVLCCLPLFWAVSVGLPAPVPLQSSFCTEQCNLVQELTGSEEVLRKDVTNFHGCTDEHKKSCQECIQSRIRDDKAAKCSQLCSSSTCREKCDCSKNDSISIPTTSATGQKAKLLCHDSQKDGAVLVLALSSQKPLKTAYFKQQFLNNWTQVEEQKINGSWVRIEKLNFSSKYEVKLISEDGQEFNGTFETLQNNLKPLEVRGVHVSNYVSGTDGALYANVSWVPAVDAACCYSVLKEGKHDLETCEPGKNWYAKWQVELGEKATFLVRPFFTFALNTGKAIGATFDVPQCPVNLTDEQGTILENEKKHCKTELPKSVCSVESVGTNENTIKLDVTWKAPEVSQRASPVVAFRLQIKSKKEELITEDTIEATKNTNDTYSWSTQVPMKSIHSGYLVKISSESSLGVSAPEILKRTFLTRRKYFWSDNHCPISDTWPNVQPKQVVVNSNIPQTVPVVSAGAGVVVVAVCIFVVAFVSHKKRATIKKRQREKKLDIYLNNSKKVNSPREKKDNRNVTSGVLQLGHKLGEGHFGVVYKAEMWQPEQKKWAVVAVKTLKSFGDEASKTQFAQESALMKEVGQHPHVISLLGEGLLPNEEGFFMAVEFCERGDLLNLLRGHSLSVEERAYVNDQQQSNNLNAVCNLGYGKWDQTEGKSPLTLTDLMSFARQIALGMEYLSSIRIVHRDLAARNVLVTADLQMKIADFGLSRDVYEGSIYFKHHGPASLPLRWMALEAIERSMYTSASDVWSFGVLLWEIWTMGKEPYAGLGASQILDALRHGHRLAKPDACPPELYKVMLQCWSEFPLSRPTFGTFRSLVETMIEAQSYLPVKESDKIRPTSEEAPLLEKTNVDSVD